MAGSAMGAGAFEGANGGSAHVVDESVRTPLA
jgi:hypothetical protein